MTSLEGVTRAAGRISSGGKIYVDFTPDDDVPGEEYPGMAMGIDFNEEAAILNPGDMLVNGRLPLPGGKEAVLGYGLAEKLGLQTGDKFAFMTVTASRSVNAMTFTITGLLDFPMAAMKNGYFLVPLDTMQGLMQMPGGRSQ